MYVVILCVCVCVCVCGLLFLCILLLLNDNIEYNVHYIHCTLMLMKPVLYTENQYMYTTYHHVLHVNILWLVLSLIMECYMYTLGPAHALPLSLLLHINTFPCFIMVSNYYPVHTHVHLSSTLFNIL